MKQCTNLRLIFLTILTLAKSPSFSQHSVDFFSEDGCQNSNGSSWSISERALSWSVPTASSAQNDVASSIYIPVGWHIEVYDEFNHGLNHSVGIIRKSGCIELSKEWSGHWNNKISSAKILKSPSYIYPCYSIGDSKVYPSPCPNVSNPDANRDLVMAESTASNNGCKGAKDIHIRNKSNVQVTIKVRWDISTCPITHDDHQGVKDIVIRANSRRLLFSDYSKCDTNKCHRREWSYKVIDPIPQTG